MAMLAVAVVLLLTDKFVLRERAGQIPGGSGKKRRHPAVRNLSRDTDNAYFTDGVQDEILTDLAKIADLKVISRTSVMQYKSGVPRNLREIAQQLGVAMSSKAASSARAKSARQRAVDRCPQRRASLGADL